MTANHVDFLVEKAKKAVAEFRTLTQEQADAIVEAVGAACAENKDMLAEMAIEETGLGKLEDKVMKNHVASIEVPNYLRGKKSVGIIREEQGIIEVAEPFGVVAGITPTTNPTSTTIFKAMIALKGRNAVVFAFHPRAQKCSEKAARICQEAAIKAGAPVNCIQWIKQPSVEATSCLIQHPHVNAIVATGGGAMVKAAYSSGHPAFGVGPGNVPAYVEKSADLELAVECIIASKTFDNGTTCSSEQSVIFDDAAVAHKALALFRQKGAYVCNEVEREKLARVMFDHERGVPSVDIVGQFPEKIAQIAGFEVPEGTKLLIIDLSAEKIGPEDMLSHEKLSPVLGWLVVSGKAEAIATAVKQLEFGGAGHTASIFTADEDIAKEYGVAVPASRVIWNQPALQGTMGIDNDLAPSFTLGCGADGGNVTSENIQYHHLLNIKRIARRTRN